MRDVLETAAFLVARACLRFLTPLGLESLEEEIRDRL